MENGSKLVKSWRQLAAQAAQEHNPERRAELTDKMLAALEKENRQADARLADSSAKHKAG